jgi:hypothetical protein
MRARTDLWEPWAGNRPGPPGLRQESLEKEDDEHDVSQKPFAGTLRVKARPGEPDQHLEASLAR